MQKNDFINNTYEKPKIIYNINDFVILGNSYLNLNSNFAFLLGRDMVSGFILHISTGNLELIKTGNNIIRAYHSPFNHGYCMIFRTAKNEYKFTQNFSQEINPPSNIENGSKSNDNVNYTNLFNFKCGDLVCFTLEKNEHIIDILFNTTSDYCFCATSMISSINIYNREMKFIISLNFNFKESPYIISSLLFLDSTLIYSRNDSILYFYPYDNINQLIFRNNRKPLYISGILPDRFILVSITANSNISICDITSPMINPLEPILIGYLDSPNIDYDLVKQCVINMFTNQISQKLIDKLINKKLKEIAWLFIDDEKSTFQNLDIKINLLNENLKFEKIIENIFINKNFNDKLDIDDIMWKLNYDSNYQYIKDLLIKELKILISFGQYALNYTDNILINNIFNFTKIEEKKDSENKDNILNNADMDKLLGAESNNIQNIDDDKMMHYHKIFDNYEGEHFIFGANLNEFKINYIEGIKNKVDESNPKKDKPHDFGIKKKIINFGEKPFNIYSDDYNMLFNQMSSVEIYSLILQKIENYYGIINRLSKTEKQKMNKMMTFYNYNLSLNQINYKQNNINNEDINTDPNSKTNQINNDDNDDENDDNLNGFVDDISEELYLCAYYHCDRGDGEILEDITQNENNALIKCIYNNNPDKKDKNAKKEKKENDENNEEETIKNIWSEVLDENRPLEYEDKWGRRSPPPHAIIFSKKYKTKIIINNTNLLQSIEQRFTIEFWIKLKDIINMNLFVKDDFSFDIDNGFFRLTFRKQEIQPEIIKEYTLPMDFFVHIAILYKRSEKSIVILLNCEEILKFNTTLTIENNTPLTFGNEKLEGEMTEIRIWNRKLPIEYIKENYKTPLSILAENKGKLKMNINIQSKNVKNRSETIFLFGDKKKEKEKIFDDSNNEMKNFSKSSKNNIIINNNNISDFNNIISDFEILGEDYPSIDVVNSNINNGNNNNNNFNNQISSKDFFFHEKDFIFDK